MQLGSLIEILVKNMKKMIALTLAAESEQRTRDLKVTSAEDIVARINKQMTILLFNAMS